MRGWEVLGQSVGCRGEAYGGGGGHGEGNSSLQGQMQNHRGAEVPLSFKGTPSGHATFTVIELGNLTHGTSEDILGLNYRSPEASPTVYSYKLGRF